MTSPGKLESETPETDALTTAPVDPAVNYASAKLTNALNLCASLERRLRAATQPVEAAELHRVAGEILAARIAAERERRKTDYVLFDKLRTMIERLARERNHWREARRVAIEGGELLRQRAQAAEQKAERLEKEIQHAKESEKLSFERQKELMQQVEQLDAERAITRWEWQQAELSAIKSGEKVMVPREVVAYCRHVIAAQCRALAIANETKEYKKATEIRSQLEEAEKAMLAARKEDA